jgi:hypothetical protein
MPTSVGLLRDQMHFEYTAVRGSLAFAPGSMYRQGSAPRTMAVESLSFTGRTSFQLRV